MQLAFELDSCRPLATPFVPKDSANSALVVFLQTSGQGVKTSALDPAQSLDDPAVMLGTASARRVRARAQLSPLDYDLFATFASTAPKSPSCVVRTNTFHGRKSSKYLTLLN